MKEYSFLLPKVCEALRNKDYESFPEGEQQLIAYMLSQLRDYIQAEKFYVSKSKIVKMFDIWFQDTDTIVFTYQQGRKELKFFHVLKKNIEQNIIGKYFEKFGIGYRIAKSGDLYFYLDLNSKSGTQ